MFRLFLLCLFIATASSGDLKIEHIDIPQECAQKSTTGDILTISYETYTVNGEPIDLARGELFTFQLGSSNFIKAFNYGLKDMCVGEKRKLIIPPEMGVLDNGKVIPGNIYLIVYVELIEINSSIDEHFKKIDENSDNQLTPTEDNTAERIETEELTKPTSENDKLIEEILQGYGDNENDVIIDEDSSIGKHDEL